MRVEERVTHHTVAELLAIKASYKADNSSWPMGRLHLLRQIQYKS